MNSQKYHRIFILFLLLFGCNFGIQDQSTNIIEHQTLQLTEDGWPKSYPAWSPDGSMIAFTSNQTFIELFKASLDGQNQDALGRIEDVIIFRWFALSPDGQRIAYSSSRRGHLWVTDLLDNSEILLTPEQRHARDPAWSPDGNWIAFSGLSPSDLRLNIWLVPVTGGPATLLTSPDIHDFTPTWSPDGSEIAFESLKNNGRAIRVVSITAGAIRDLSSDSTRNSHPTWSPDGSAIAFESYRNDTTGIWAIPAQGGKEIKLTKNLRTAGNPVWSPDGSTIAFDSISSSIWTIPAQGGNEVNLTKNLTSARDPVWSPDGKKIAFIAANSEIWVISANGGELTQTSIREVPPLWFPNSNSLLAINNKIALSNINIVSLEDFKTTTITEGLKFQRDIHPTWLSDNDRIAFARREFTAFSSSFQILTISRSGGEATPLFADADFAHQQINPEISRDGTRIIFDNYFDIFVCAVSNGDPINLTSEINERLSDPSWSPDGKQVACIGENSLNIYAIKANRLIEQAKIPGSFSSLSWSPYLPVFGSHIAVESSGSIYTLSLAEQNPEFVSRGQFPHWSPDGTKLAYILGNKIYVSQILKRLPE